MAGRGSGRDEDALSEIIGFVLVLALIVVASTLYLMYVVPAEGREDEIEHMNQVQDRFVSYKTSVDGLWLRSIDTSFFQPGTGGVSLSTSFDLGTGGGNTQSTGLFLSFMRPIGTAAKMRTQLDTNMGTLTDETDRLNLTVDGIEQFVYTDEFGIPRDGVPIGSLSYHTDNYYWIQQIYHYKLGGVFLEQPGEGVSVKVAPPIAIYQVQNATDPLRYTTKISLSLVNITSDDSTVGGTGPLRVETRLKDSMSHQDTKVKTLTLRIEDGDPLWVRAWHQVFVDAAKKSGLPTAHLNIEDAHHPNANQWFYIPDWNPGDTETSLTIRNKTAIFESPPAPKDVYLDLNQAALQVTFEYDES